MKVRCIKRRAYALHAHELQLRQICRRHAQEAIVRILNRAIAGSIAKVYEPLLLIIRTMGDVFAGSAQGATASFRYQGDLK